MPTETRASSLLKRRQRQSLVIALLATILIGFFSAPIRSQDPVETIRIDSDLVDLKVSVLGVDPDIQAPLLEQNDFQVLEDGAPQEISFFAAADAPFDLVLLLDISGSTAKKLKMIRRSAKRFVDAARPVDRIAIAAFTDELFMLSNLTLDRKQLKKEVDSLDDAYGGTNFWDALDLVLKDIVRRNNDARRSAVVVMTDGVDNALPDVKGPGSAISFEQLLENTRKSEAIIFPIYLDTEKEDAKAHQIPATAYAQAREQLAQIASTSGTTLYRADKVEDLDRLYAQVIRDLSTVYSIGYRPTNRTLDGKWRTVQVQLPGRPKLQARTRRGYYAKLAEKS